MLQPFSTKLNAAILHIASRIYPLGFDVQGVDTDETAPSTYRELVDRFESGKRFVVASEGSTNTIYGDPEVNYAFRAWHDWTHWRGQCGFSLVHESFVCADQIKLLRELYGWNDETRKWARLLHAEIIGQKQAHDTTGRFPMDQRAFVTHYLERHPDLYAA